MSIFAPRSVRVTCAWSLAVPGGKVGDKVGVYMNKPIPGPMPVGCRVPEAGGGIGIGFVSTLRQAIAYPSSSL